LVQSLEVYLSFRILTVFKRICQIVIARHEKVEWESVEILLETDRGSAGLGHTGKE
jgi:dUTPase